MCRRPALPWCAGIVIVLGRAAVRTRRICAADWPKLKRSAGLMLLFAAVGGGAFGTLQFVALHYTTALNMGVVGSVAPAFIVAASWLLFRDRLSWTAAAGRRWSRCRACWPSSAGSTSARLASLSFNGGDLIIIANMVLWAIYAACLRLRPDVHPMTFMLAMAVIAGLGNLPFALLRVRVRLSPAIHRADADHAALLGVHHHAARLRRLEPRHRHRRRAAGERVPAHHPAVQRDARHHDPGRDASSRTTSSASP